MSNNQEYYKNYNKYSYDNDSFTRKRGRDDSNNFKKNSEERKSIYL